jgi:hypothetical protein
MPDRDGVVTSITGVACPRTAMLVFVVTVCTAACMGIGPGTVNRDRFDYTTAVAESWKRQMLLNLVKLRYGDTPIFLDVGQIVAGYTVQSTFTAAATANVFGWSSAPHPTLPDASLGLGAQGSFTDRPTITYSPLAGERFARSMMTPLPPTSIMSLIQAGYPADVVFRLTVHVVNGLHNRYGGDFRARSADSEFYALLGHLRRIQLSGLIGLRLLRAGPEEAVVLSFRQRRDPTVDAEILAARKLLGLDPAATEYRVVYGAVAANEGEIAMLTRSILEVLIDLSSFISVPAAHVAERRVGPTSADDEGPEGRMAPLLRITTAVDRPDDAFAAVPYRGYWFWIDDRDLASKKLFTFLLFVFTLVETTSREAPPVVTIPAQ